MKIHLPYNLNGGGFFMDCLNKLSRDELVLLAATVAIAIGKGKTKEELDLLGNFISAVGQNLNTMAVVD